jgi:hypothetical protein
VINPPEFLNEMRGTNENYLKNKPVLRTHYFL